jgi:hypothetical protein
MEQIILQSKIYCLPTDIHYILKEFGVYKVKNHLVCIGKLDLSKYKILNEIFERWDIPKVICITNCTIFIEHVNELNNIIILKSTSNNYISYGYIKNNMFNFTNYIMIK